MLIFKSINKLNKKVNFKANIGFVPTMGALHKGHISLIHKSQRRCKKTLVSIFINPSQFNKKKDFNKYPRTFNKDIKILKKLKVDYLLLPKTNEIYKNKKNMKIKLSIIDKVLCAKYRPGHFEGVLGVINQLLRNIKINLNYIFLGEKDYQQVYLIKKFIKNKFNIKVVACKTKRNKNHLALSSRNLLLSKKYLEKAEYISQYVRKYYLTLKNNFKNIKKINEVKKEIVNIGAKIEYFELRNKNNLSKKCNKRNFKIFFAYYLQNIRLIDNF
tara:strand:+ start:239 stop:1054 length:816 start_codon:yes stop_codon:yes gene_type:complete